MPTEAEMRRLVETHRQLDEPMEGAIWISPDDPTAWLVEILPELPSEEDADRPIVFTPNGDFRYSLHLYAGNLGSLEEAVRRNVDLARNIAQGAVLHDTEQCQALMRTARKVVAG